MSSFFLAEAKAQVQGSPTMRQHALINWPATEQKLVGLYKRKQSRAGGPEPDPPLGMFKLMLLGQWHGLSDVQLEEALKVHLEFLVFGGVDLGSALPDISGGRRPSVHSAGRPAPGSVDPIAEKSASASQQRSP